MTLTVHMTAQEVAVSLRDELERLNDENKQYRLALQEIKEAARGDMGATFKAGMYCPLCGVDIVGEHECYTPTIEDASQMIRDRINLFEKENGDFRHALEEIRGVADVSEGAQFYAMLARKALDG